MNQLQEPDRCIVSRLFDIDYSKTVIVIAVKIQPISSACKKKDNTITMSTLYNIPVKAMRIHIETACPVEKQSTLMLKKNLLQQIEIHQKIKQFSVVPSVD